MKKTSKKTKKKLTITDLKHLKGGLSGELGPSESGSAEKDNGAKVTGAKEKGGKWADQ